jgi:hypothetical protein
MAFVDDDEVEEASRELPVEPGAGLVLGDGLIDGEVHLPALAHDAALDLEAGLAERGEGLVLRIVHQDVAIGEEQDARLAVGALPVPAPAPELPADLKGDHGLACAGGHAQQDTASALEHGLDDAVDRDLLVVPEVLSLLATGGRQQARGRFVAQGVGLLELVQ